MPVTTNLPNEAVLKWSGKELEAKARLQMYKLLLAGCEMVKAQAQRNVSVSARSRGPSKPGEFPHADTGRLRNSIFAEVDEKALSGIVGTPLKYGLWLEYGTRGGKVIRAHGKAMTWVGRDGKRRFAKQIVQGPIQARSYLRRSMKEMEPKLAQLFGAYWPKQAT